MNPDKTRLNIAAIIPARGGSKGLSKKNILPICGHPLISWSIKQAQLANHISSTWVTSEDSDILEIASSYGSGVIKRPKELALDSSTSESAWIHAIDYLYSLGIEPDFVIGMQATSPIREPKDLDGAISSVVKNNYDSLLSVTEIEDYFTWEKDSDSNCRPLNYDPNNRKRRQEINKLYIENGSFYLFKPSLIKSYNNRLSGRIGIYSIEKYKSFQIDNKEDFKICSAILKEYGFNQS